MIMEKWDKTGIGFCIWFTILGFVMFALTFVDNTVQWEMLVGCLISFSVAGSALWTAYPKEPEVIDPGEGYRLVDTKVDNPFWNDEFLFDGIWLRREAGTATFSKGQIYRRPLTITWDEKNRTDFFRHMLSDDESSYSTHEGETYSDERD